MAIKQTLGCTALLLSMAVQAQIYEHTDKEGNVTFSDVPTPGAEELELQDTNTANSVEVRPPAPPAAAAQAADGPEAADMGPTYIGGGNDDDLLEAKRSKERREEIRERIGNGNPEVAPHRPSPQARPAGARR